MLPSLSGLHKKRPSHPDLIHTNSTLFYERPVFVAEFQLSCLFEHGHSVSNSFIIR